MESSVTGTLTAGTLVSTTSVLKARLARGGGPEAIYAPIDEHRTAASNSDVAAAWLAAGLVGLSLLAVLAL